MGVTGVIKGTPWDENFQFWNLHHIKLYILLILSKIQKHKKNNFKTLKTTKLILFPRCILSCQQSCHNPRRHDQSNHRVASIAAALNTSLIGLGMRWSGGGMGSPTAPMVCSSLGRLYQFVAKYCARIQPDQCTLCLGYSWLVINIVIYILRKVFENLKNLKKKNNQLWVTLLH